MPALTLDFSAEVWPLKSAFVIARGAKTEAHVVRVRVSDGAAAGEAECVPYARYGETVEGVVRAIANAGPITDRATLQKSMPAGAARNAIDCALWDLEAKRTGRSAATLAGIGPLRPLETCYTLSLAAADEMAAAAQAVPQLKLLKLKLGGAGDAARMHAVRHARPDARLVADANESWSTDELVPFLAAAAEARIELIEQPLPAGSDQALAAISHPVPVCADESAHTSADIGALKARYDAVNIKLDKAGGLTEALVMANAARAAGLKTMVGCMVATSLSMAPAFLLAQGADWVDLDGPLLLAKDRPHGLVIEAGLAQPPEPALWG
jgi:L-alanine-DL-glutamate epimerase-like enolase superfamily enzyme